MSTRSLTHVKEEGLKSRTIITMYRQYDGYLEGHGKDLSDFLKQFTIVNGIGLTDKKIANGMECLAAQIVVHFKDGAGGIYLYPPDTKDVWEEYTYTVYLENNKLKIKVDEEDIDCFVEDIYKYIPEET